MANSSSKTNDSMQLSMVESIANAEEDDIESPLLLQFDITMDDENISNDDDDDTSVLSLNLFDVESVFDSDTDSDDEAYSCLPSLELSTADDFYQDEDGTFIAVDYDDEDESNMMNVDRDDMKQGDDMVIMEDYPSHGTEDKFIVTVDGDVGYGDDNDDFEDHNERNMVYLSNAYSNTTSRSSIDFDCSQYIMDTPISPLTTAISYNSNPFNIPQFGPISSSNNHNNNLSRPEMVEMETFATSIKSEEIHNNNNEGETAQEIVNNDTNGC